MRVLDYTEIQYKDFASLIESVKSNVSFEAEVEQTFFAFDGNLVTANWETGNGAQDYVNTIRQAGRSDLLGWLNDQYARRLQGVYEDFSERYGWGDAGNVAEILSQAAQGQPSRGAEEGEVRFSGRVRGSDGVLAGARRPYQSDGRQGYTLEGLPAEVEVDGQLVEFAGFAPAQKAAEEYANSRGLSYAPPKRYAKVDPQRASRIADAFDQMEHNPSDPEVAAAYDAMIEETIAQYEVVLATGLEVEFIRGDDPYGNPRNAILDVVENNHMYVFSTRDGFGSSDFDPSDNPLLRETDFTISGETALVNDLFRVVHDYFGHIKNGVGFRAAGEENAWRAHSSMYSPLARQAMTTETRGQNSWVNYGPSSEFNRTASGADTIYADQKIGLLPEWVVNEGANDEDIDFSPRRNPRQPTSVDTALGRIRSALAGQEGQALDDAGITIVLPNALPRERRVAVDIAR